MRPDVFDELTSRIGPENVAADDATLALYGRTTLDHAPQPAAVVYPRSTEDVQAVVRIASQHGVVVHPLSRGKNWGYGDACAATQGSIIVDLSRMDRICEVNVELGYAVIEAGVSQQQLYDYLREKRIPLWLDCTGAGPDSSFVGNTLDHGFGHTRYGDHFLTTCGMEIVLADGRVLKTGYGHYPNARTSHVYPYGTGPYLDGIFCQSNLGIVTKIGLWLMPEPEAFCLFLIKLDTDKNLPALIDRLRELRMAGMLVTAIHCGNDLRILSSAGRYPWAESRGVTPLSDDLRRKLRDAAGLGAWNAGGSLTGTPALVRAQRAAVKKALRGMGRLVFITDTKLALGDFAAKCLGLVGLGRKLRAQLQSVKPNYGLLKGIPSTEPLLGAQWRLRRPLDGVSDPLEAGCGLMWISPVLPATGRDASMFLDVVTPIFKQHRFDTLVTFTLINERAMIAITNVAFDKSQPDEAGHARACYDALMGAVINAGYYPYRTSLAGMPKLRDRNDTFWQVAKDIKRALDPKDIIARGRYVPPLND